MAVPRKKATLALEALGNSVRREIMRIIARQPSSVGDIAKRLPISRPAVSKHLRILESAALVQHQKCGTRNVFELRRAGFEAARGWLDAFWYDALSRFKMVAENVEEKR